MASLEAMRPASWISGWSIAALECAQKPLPSKTKFALELWASLEASTCPPGASTLCNQPFAYVQRFSCDYKLPPAFFIAWFTIATLFFFWGMLSILSRCLRWYSAKRGSAFVAVATAAARDLRSRNPDVYPEAKHCWVKCPPLFDTAPVCSVCYNPVSPNEANACEICGTVAHSHRCARHAPCDCKPFSVLSERPAHDWRPAGTILSLKDFHSGVSQADFSFESAGNDDASDLPPVSSDSIEMCVFCDEPCEGGLYAVEPVWSCSCCHQMAHVRCFVEREPDSVTAVTRAALVAQLRSLEEEPAFDEGHVFACPSSPKNSMLLLNCWDEGGIAMGHKAGWPASGPMTPLSRDSKEGEKKDAVGPLRPSASVNTSSHLPASASAAQPPAKTKAERSTKTPPPALSTHTSLPSEPPDFRQRSQSTPGMVPRPGLEPAASSDPFSRSPLNGQTAFLGPEVCRLGLSRGLALPNTIFCPMLRASEARFLNFRGSTVHDGTNSDSDTGIGSSGGRGGAPSVPASSSMGRLTAVAASGASRVRDGTVSGPSGTSLRDASWWRGSKLGKWESYKIDMTLIGKSWRPLLVFVNMKSGPQVGSSLKLQLLQVLHPLQVVELPKEDPEPSLRCFMGVPNLRIVVVGGDGTVGWILSVLDKLVAAERSDGVAGGDHSAASTAWQVPAGLRQPPVAVMPLGTGNDLARCLNWGGGYGSVRHSLIAFLVDVSKAAVTHMDRWDVAVFTHTTSRIMKRPWVFRNRKARGGMSASPSVSSESESGFASTSSSGRARTNGKHSPTAKLQKKLVLNNYLGIGIDAKVALEFHHMRNSFPSLFKSQVGNKMWYTGVGAGDLVWRSCINIADRLQIVCDGVELQIPPDAQGIVIMNIYCHMGGVYMWANGLPAEPLPGGETITRYRDQSMSDGLLEVVAIGGVAHMGRLAVGLARAQRLCQCTSITITTKKPLPMQVDGEPWMQAPGEVTVSLRGRGMMLKRVAADSRVARAATLVNEVLESNAQQGVITEIQRQRIAADMTAKLEPLL